MYTVSIPPALIPGVIAGAMSWHESLMARQQWEIGADRWVHTFDQVRALCACEFLRRLAASSDGLKQELVQFGGADLSGVFEVLDEQAEKLGRALGNPVGYRVGDLMRESRVDAAAGRKAVSAMGLLVKHFVSVHGDSPEVVGWGESRQSAYGECPPSVSAGN